MIQRPVTSKDEATHTYYVEGAESVSVSQVAKIGNIEAFGIGSAWGFKIGYSGALAVLENDLPQPVTEAQLRELLKKNKLTPWAKTKEGGDRGTWAHEVFEELAQEGKVRNLGKKVPKQYVGYAKGIFQWYVDYRPEFVTVEVEVVSKRGFAGRYDCRCLIDSHKLGLEVDGGEQALILLDLKTTKAIYPEQHYPQLSGYELGSVEMGFPPTDGQYVLLAHADGTYEFGPETRNLATEEDFLAYLAAIKAIKRIQALDKQRRKAKVRRKATKGA